MSANATAGQRVVRNTTVVPSSLSPESVERLKASAAPGTTFVYMSDLIGKKATADQARPAEHSSNPTPEREEDDSGESLSPTATPLQSARMFTATATGEGASASVVVAGDVTELLGALAAKK